MKRKARRNTGWAKDFFSILLFLFLFTYFAVSFKDQKEELKKNREERNTVETAEKGVSADQKILAIYEQLSDLPHNGKYYVVWEDEGINLRLPLENFLIGALASSIPVTYEKEVLKAQAILLRSTLCMEYEKREKEENAFCVHIGSDKCSFWTDYKMQSMWGKNYPEYVQKCAEAVAETQGIYLSYNAKAVKGFYHGMSAGQTRDEKELSGSGEYDYLKMNICTDNLSAADYIVKQRIKRKEAGELTGMTADEEGYVISVYRNGEEISGEALRKILELESSNFTWEEDGEYYIFTTKGRGHGFGLDQYYGNVLAAEGEDYEQILDYFFADVTFKRME